ncbi:hypothetical protein [Aliiroseovarius sediminis]|uniref:hypothetical protein n=1 Tax=Aliiroseovarius sediminis TaxID=2925839 RepID=UPI001F57D70A|nr:hypothetical protein [Aliiroseovarius sediminis]MCI2393243.1 hypothetical protein [Aliiroseovarius sediminis]
MSMRHIMNNVESALPYVFPAIGGLLAVVVVNMRPMAQMNPMIWIPVGIFLGWIAARGALRMLDWLR